MTWSAVATYPREQLYHYIDSDLICDGSMTTNYSKNQCGTVNDPTGSP